MPEQIDVYKQDSGKILKEVLTPGGAEKIVYGASVILHYTGTLLDGTKFDSSRDRRGPFQFNVGKGEVIDGLDIGISSMKRGEQAILTIAPEYAYGAEGYPPSIPPNSTLKFDVEILDWKYEDLSGLKNGSIERKETTEPGIGYAHPKDEAFVQVHIRGKYESEVFEDREAIIGPEENNKDEIPEGIKMALKKLKWGEQTTLSIRPELAENAPCFKDKDLSIHGTVQYDVKVKCFEKIENWSTDADEKIQISEMLKERGNYHFKKAGYADAVVLYEKVLKNLLEKDGEPIKQSDEACSKLILSALLNSSLCYLKIKNYEKAKESAFKAITKASDNDKAHYRYGMALVGLSEKEKAKEHFENCLKINPSNSEAKLQLEQINKDMKISSDIEKKRYQNMFGKLAEKDVKQEDQGSNKS